MMTVDVQIEQHSEETFRAWCPGLPGCQVRGKDPKEARAKIEEAVRGYLASMNNLSEPRLRVSEK